MKCVKYEQINEELTIEPVFTKAENKQVSE